MKIFHPKISVIIPVYNAEKYISRCVDSILSQTTDDFELLLIDDGSQDSSGNICDNYSLADKRIKTIHKSNGGVSSARQCGLDNSTGEYVIHIDSDDWIEPHMFQTLISFADKNQADIVIFDFYRVSKNSIDHIIQKPSSFDHISVLRDIVSGRLYASCWNKLVRHSIINRYDVTFPEGVNLGEDKCFLAKLLINNISIAYLPSPLYYYDVVVNSSSLVRNITKESITSGFSMLNYLQTILDKDFNVELYEVRRRLMIRAIKSQLYTRKQIYNLFKPLYKQVFLQSIVLNKCSRDDIGLLLYIIGFKRLSLLLFT